MGQMHTLCSGQVFKKKFNQLDWLWLLVLKKTIKNIDKNSNTRERQHEMPECKESLFRFFLLFLLFANANFAIQGMVTSVQTLLKCPSTRTKNDGRNKLFRKCNEVLEWIESYRVKDSIKWISKLRNEKRLKSDIKRAYSRARVEVTLLSKL